MTKQGTLDDLSRRESLTFSGSTLGVKASKGAFTLIELLVVIAIIAILAAVLLPVLHQAQERGEAAACIDHQKQLSTAWVMYASDNNDYCAGNEWGAGGAGSGGEEDWPLYKGKWYRPASLTPCTNWVSGWLDPSGSSPNGDIMGIIGMTQDSDNTNQDLLIDPSYATLGDYTKNPLLYICPSCQVKVSGYPGGPKTFNEIRSVSMNCWVGFVCGGAGQGTTPATTYKIFTKTTSITAGMSPVDLFVFMEERGESIDDGWFEVAENGTTMENWPTDYHNLAAAIGFADGHVEMHRWVGTGANYVGGQLVGTTVPQQAIVTTKWGGVGLSSRGSGLTDLNWLQAHASCLQN
jgi:prepilin-type N-terminal cleavage/methylation domain-containing protein/prepilin-type processing-associated H-X9-DG protein